jgi:hypothetical protein
MSGQNHFHACGVEDDKNLDYPFLIPYHFLNEKCSQRPVHPEKQGWLCTTAEIEQVVHQTRWQPSAPKLSGRLEVPKLEPVLSRSSTVTNSSWKMAKPLSLHQLRGGSRRTRPRMREAGSHRVKSKTATFLERFFEVSTVRVTSSRRAKEIPGLNAGKSLRPAK